MEDGEWEMIQATCYSELTGDSVSFGIGYNSGNGKSKEQDLSWIGEGLSEAFWENYRDFESGVEIANTMCSKDQQLTLKKALFLVFGHFKISFELNGQPYNLLPDFDIDEAMYTMLEDVVL